MPDPDSNPFASPEIEDLPANTGPLHQSITIGRWIGGSPLSGILLFAAYFVGSMALCVSEPIPQTPAVRNVPLAEPPESRKIEKAVSASSRNESCNNGDQVASILQQL